MKLVAIIFSLYFSNFALAEIRIQFSGTDSYSRVAEEMVIESSGRVRLNSYSPFPYTFRNRNLIGEVKGKTSSATIKKIWNGLQSPLEKRQAGFIIRDDAILVTVVTSENGKKRKFIWEYATKPELIQIERIYFRIKETLVTPGEVAMQLDCESAPHDMADCSLKNLGTQEILTVDPRGAPSAIACLSADLARIPINTSEIAHPSQMRPPKIRIGPRSAFKFSTRINGCRGRISVRTDFLLLNKNYSRYLLGELLSQPLGR